jgi:hypothetical protein
MSLALRCIQMIRLSDFFMNELNKIFFGLRIGQ